MTTLNLVDLVDHQFNLKPKFFYLRNFYEKVKEPELKIFGINEEFSKIPKEVLRTVFFPSEVKVLPEEFTFLEGYRKLVQGEIFGKISHFFNVNVANCSTLSKEIRTKRNFIKGFNLAYTNVFNNILYSKISYVYCPKIEEILDSLKKVNGDFHSKNRNFLLGVYKTYGFSEGLIMNRQTTPKQP